MNYKLLKMQVNRCKDIIEEVQLGDHRLYFLKEEYDKDNLQSTYLNIIGRDKVDKVVSRMLVDSEFRNFMLINLQNMLTLLRKIEVDSIRKYTCFIKKQGNRDIYEINNHDYIGFIAGKIPEEYTQSLNAQSIDFISDLTKAAIGEVRDIKYGTRNETKPVDVQKELILQVRKLAETGGFTRDEVVITNRAALVKDPFDHEKTRAFFSAWQLNVFFEQFIAKFIERELDTECHTNRKLCILPNKGKYIDGLLETDIIGHDKKSGGLILVECKNGKLYEKEISKFIGRSKIIESAYGKRIDKKIMVGTKYIDWFFKPLPRGTSIVGINWFDSKDYREDSCYTKLSALLRR